MLPMIPEEFIEVTNQNSKMPIEFGKKNKQKMGTYRKMGEGGHKFQKRCIPMGLLGHRQFEKTREGRGVIKSEK